MNRSLARACIVVGVLVAGAGAVAETVGTTVGGPGGLTGASASPRPAATPSPTAKTATKTSERGGLACAEDVSPDPVAVVPPKRLDVALARDEAFTLSVRNLGSSAASVGLLVRAFSAAQNVEVAIPPTSIAKGGNGSFRLTPAALKLAATPLDWSGEIVVVPFVKGRSGRVEADRRLRLWFHREKDGWRIYDDAVRRERHPDGAVSDAALAARKLPDPFAGEKGVAERFGPVRVVKRSESTTAAVARAEDGKPEGAEK